MDLTHRTSGLRAAILFLGSVALWSSVGLAVPAAAADRAPRIGYFMARGPDASLDDAFLKGLRDAGYEEGKSISIVRRFGYNKPEALPVIAQELNDMSLDLIVVAAHDAALAMKKVTTKTPIITATGVDPIGIGLVESLQRPGGNITGMTNVAVNLIGKEFQILKELVPGQNSVGLLVVSWNPALGNYLSEARMAAQELGLQLHVAQLKDPEGLEAAFRELSRNKVGSAFASVDPLLFMQRNRVAELASKYRIPTSAPWQQYAMVGGIVSYGPKLADNFFRTASYVDKVLRGANPAELPMQQPTSYEMIINLKTAKSFGMKIPDSLLLRADKVIE